MFYPNILTKFVFPFFRPPSPLFTSLVHPTCSSHFLVASILRLDNTFLSSCSPLLALLTGLVLGLSSSAAHNWFHQADSRAWRRWDCTVLNRPSIASKTPLFMGRFYFDLSCLSHQEWRISHALSHHLHTNSLTDVEVVFNSVPAVAFFSSFSVCSCSVFLLFCS